MIRARGGRAGSWRVAIAAVAVFAVSRGALAQTAPTVSETDRAKVLYAAGAAAYAAGNFAAAAQALTEAYAIAPRPTVLFSLAQAERQLYTLERRASVLRDAIAHYRAYVEQTPQGGRRTDAVEVLGELESDAARLAVDSDRPEPPHAAPTRLMISTQVVGAIVAIDGVDHDERPVIEETRPGLHVVVTRAPGYFEDSRTVTSIEGSLVATEVNLRERPARVLLTAPEGTEVAVDGKPFGVAPLGELDVAAGTHLFGFSGPGRVPEIRTFTATRGGLVELGVSLRRTTQRKVSYGILGAGVVAVVGGAAASVVALVEQGDALGVRTAAADGNISQGQLDGYNGSLDRRDAWRTGALVSFGVGGVLLLTGALLYVIDHEQPVDGVDHIGGGSRTVAATAHGIVISF